MKGFIYIIRSFQTDDVYYGSTTQILCKRMSQHRRDYKKWLNNKRDYYLSAFELIKFNDAYIELIEEVEFKNKQELYASEGHYIRVNNCVNKFIPCRTQKEWYETNRKRVAEYHKKYLESKRIMNED